ncbi:uncharacterized protein [Rutidosis leptorrhynchoides]|uniref:uncharacterized protein isoform X2 n=1 Tax=Rutidosis leptorrhynchoides TaxID=125765 RepID=UPI003A9A59EE
MDLNPFKLDIDELIGEFAEDEMTTLAHMKRIWLSKKFTCIFEAKPNTKLGFFMQSLYGHCIGYMTSSGSISHRLGGLYCLYCLHETQPFNPPFRIYISIQELKRLKELVRDAKKVNIKDVPLLVNNMLKRNFFLYGAIDLKEGSVEERLNELTSLQNARVQHANKKLFADTQIEHYIHMDMGKELDVDSLKKISREYAMAKELAIKVNQALIGDVIEKTTQDWNNHKEAFYQQTGLNQHQHFIEKPSSEQPSINENAEADDFIENSGMQDGGAYAENDDNFCDELEQQLLSLEEL